MIGQEEKNMIVGVLPFLNDNPIIFDVGSNKGGFTDIMLEEFKDKCSLHLFEPNSKLLSFTEIKYEYKKNIVYNETALYNTCKEKTFFYFENENNELSSLEDGCEEWKGLPTKQKQVITDTVDNYCEKNDIKFIDLLKIDAEGSDYKILLGATKMLSENKIGIATVEYGYHYNRFGALFKSVIYLVKQYGYDVYEYKNDNYNKIDAANFEEDYRFENFIISKYDLHNYSTDGNWCRPFIESVQGLPKMDICIEIGCYEGVTSRYICENMLNEGGRLIAIDPLMDVYVDGDTAHPYFNGQYGRFIRNTKGLPIELKRGKSQDELPKLHALRVNFCYIDGDHYMPMPYLDACWCFAITKIGGYILFDDYLWNDDTKGSIDEFINEFSKSLQIVKKDYQLLIKKTQDQYNDLTYEYYK